MIHNINPIAFNIGELNVHWYGLMYVGSFTIIWWLTKRKLRLDGHHWSNDQLLDFIGYCAAGVMLGGRLGYLLFYGINLCLQDPWFPFKLWQGGMSFHGGVIGVTVAIYLFAKKIKWHPLQLSDLILPLAPIGLALGRLGNFINGEVWGRATNASWGMVFPAVDQIPRHPSQLYEAALEGGLLFILLWGYTWRPRAQGKVTGLFFLGYGIVRIGCEFFREPDSHLGFLMGHNLTMGQVLSLPLLLIGLWLMFIRQDKTFLSSGGTAG